MPQPHRPSQLRRRVFESRYAIDQGLLTPAQLRSQAWRRLFAGIYADASLPATHRLQCLAASSYLVPATAAIAGRSAATLLGPGLARPADPVEVLVPTPLRAGPVHGLRIHTSALDEAEVTTVGGLRVTDRRRTCWDLAQWLDPVEAVVLVDRMLATGRVTRDELLAYADGLQGRRGHQRFSRVVDLADPRAESPPESRLRVRLTLAGLPAPEVQYSVRRDGVFVGRVDLAWPELRIAIEYEGAHHSGSREQLEHDRARINALTRAGWTVLFVTADRLRDDRFDLLVRDLRAVLADRRTR